MKTLLSLVVLVLLSGCGGGGSDSGGSVGVSVGDGDGGLVGVVSQSNVIGDPNFFFANVFNNPGGVTNEWHLHEFNWTVDYPFRSYDEFEDITTVVQAELEQFKQIVFQRMDERFLFLESNEAPVVSQRRSFVERNFVEQYERADITRDAAGVITDIEPVGGEGTIIFYYDVPGGGEIEVTLVRDVGLTVGWVLSGYGVEWDARNRFNSEFNSFCIRYERWGLPAVGDSCIGGPVDVSYNRAYAIQVAYLTMLRQIRTGVVAE